jgi:hypothetical protein
MRTRDVTRQVLNLVLAVGQIVTTVLCFYVGVSFDEATASDTPEPAVIPAGYAFIIWSVIYAGAVAYAAFQSLPGQRSNPLFRRIGWFTALAFLGTNAWLVCARAGDGWGQWGTVGCILWMLVSLAGAFREFVRFDRPFTTAEQWLAVAPLSVFTGWVSVAVFANTAAALKTAGVFGDGPSEVVWSLALLAAAGVVATGFTVVSRGNVGYALTVVWALAAIVVANLTERSNPTVAVAAAVMALVVLGGMARSWLVSRPGPSAV